MNEQALFSAAVEIADPVRRAEYLTQACAGDSALRARVDALLATHERSGEFLDIPALRQMGGVSARHALPGETSAEHESQGEIDLSFLQPSTKPGSLGRLGHYEVEQVIGRGGCGIVLKAFDEKLGRIVAIKVMSPELAATSPARKRFSREARAAAAIRHENVISIHDVEDQPIPLLVMEYIAGQTLQEKLDQTGPLDLREVVQIGGQIASGLAAAHTLGLIHRDIKPANILLDRGTDRIKITDFGLARSADDASITQSGTITGTPLYMSPEQAMGTALDARSDLFSLGSVLYVMCCGRPPFRAATTLAVLKRVADEQPRPIREIIPETPDWLVAIIAKLHAKLPEERFGSAKEVADLLARCLAELEQRGRVESLAGILPLESRTATPEEKPALAPRLDPADPAASPGWSVPRPWLAAAALLLVLLAGLGMTEATGVSNFRGTIIRLFSPEGTLVIEVDDPGAKVSIDGEELVISGAGVKEIRLKAGQHQVRASKDGKLLSQELVTVTHNGRRVVRVSQEAEPAADVPSSVAVDRRPQFRTGGDWRIEGGELVQALPENARLFFGDENWTDYDFEVEAMSSGKTKDGHGIGLMFRAKDLGNFLDIDVGGWSATVTEAIYFKDGKWGRSPGCFLKIPHEHGRWYKIKIEARGSKIRCSIDGKDLLAYSDDTLLKGMIGVGTGNSPVRWRNLKVTAPDGSLLWEGFPKLDAEPTKSGQDRSADGWAQLFNGKDLTGWTRATTGLGNWKVVDGSITCSGPEDYLYSDRSDFGDFHLRAEAKINKVGNSGILLRARKSIRGGGDYEAHIASELGPGGGELTGSLWHLAVVKESLVPPDTWFTYEIIAQGDRIRLLVNGKETADYRENRTGKNTTGHIALQHHRAPGTEVRFRKIEVRELKENGSGPAANAFQNSLGMEFALVPKGTSWLGGGNGKPGDKEVKFKDDFYLGVYEVTQEEWSKVLDTNPSYYSRTGKYKDAVKDIDDSTLKRFPVENVTRDACQQFAKLLTAKLNEPGWEYRLPTESEWEYACRGGPMSGREESMFDYYFDVPRNQLLSDSANFALKPKEGLQRPTKVGSYPPNRLGLHDMHGNVCEWCDDTAPGDHSRINRGGSWVHEANMCTASTHRGWGPTFAMHDIGLRLARVRVAADPDRRAAELLIPFATLSLALPDGNYVDVMRGQTLPSGPFTVFRVHIPFGELPPDFVSQTLLPAIGELDGLRHIASAESCVRLTDDELARLIASPLGSRLIGLQFQFDFTEKTIPLLKQLPGLTVVGCRIENVPTARLAQLSELKHLQTFVCAGSVNLSLTEDHARVIERLKLTSFRLVGAKSVDKALLRVLGEMGELKDVALYNANITDDDLGALATLKLQSLDVSRNRLTDNAAPLLAKMTSLRELRLAGNSISAPVVANLAAALPQCKIHREGGLVEPTVMAKPDPDRRAAEWVLSIGGQVEVGVGDQIRSIKATSELPREPFTLITANLYGNMQITDAGLSAFEGCRSLTNLMLTRSNVTDENLRHFRGCENLASLAIGHTQVSDAGLVAFKDCADFTTLDFGNSQIGDAGLAHFKNCKQLTQLLLGRSRVTDAGLVHFKDCKDLTVLFLDNTRVTEAGLANFQGCVKLTNLNLNGLKIGDEGLANFKDCKSLKYLGLGVTQATDQGLAYFKDCQDLAEIRLDKTQVTDAGLATLRTCQNLQRLNLQDTQVSDAGLEFLGDLKMLQTINLQNTKVTAKGVEKLAASLPQCKFE